MFAYCLNNPVNRADQEGLLAIGIADPDCCEYENRFGAGMLFVAIVAVGTIAYTQGTESSINTQLQPLNALKQLHKALRKSKSHDDDDDYSNITRVGYQRGNAPRNNKNQNDQVRAIIKKLGLSAYEARRLHDAITGEGYGFKEILQIAEDMFEKR